MSEHLAKGLQALSDIEKHNFPTYLHKPEASAILAELRATRNLLDHVADAPLKLEICVQNLAVAKDRIATLLAACKAAFMLLSSTPELTPDYDDACAKVRALLCNALEKGEGVS